MSGMQFPVDVSCIKEEDDAGEEKDKWDSNKAKRIRVEHMEETNNQLLQSEIEIGPIKIEDNVYNNINMEGTELMPVEKTPEKVENVSQPNVLHLILEELKYLRKEVKDLKEQSTKMMVKLTEEMIAVKLEARKHRNDLTSFEFFDSQKLPFSSKEAFEEFENAMQENEDKLHKFKEFIGKICGDGAAAFLRTAVRKVFADELAVTYSWKGTSTKPSAEKSFVVATIKNVCYLKFLSTDKEMNIVLQKHFVHAGDRVAAKRKRT